MGEVIIKGYMALNMDKILNKDVTFELNKWLYKEKHIMHHIITFHLCDTLALTSLVYNYHNCKFFEVAAKDVTEINFTGISEMTAPKVKLIKEISAEEIEQYLIENKEQLIKNENVYIRKLINSSENKYSKIEVAAKSSKEPIQYLLKQ